MSTKVDTTSSWARVNLGLRFVLEIGMFTGIVYASIVNYDDATSWTASVVGVLVAASLWGVFAVQDDPSRSGKTVVDTPGLARLILELGLFATVSVWLAVGEAYIYAGILAVATVVHYAAWPARIRWLLSN